MCFCCMSPDVGRAAVRRAIIARGTRGCALVYHRWIIDAALAGTGCGPCLPDRGGHPPPPDPGPPDGVREAAEQLRVPGDLPHHARVRPLRRRLELLPPPVRGPPCRRGQRLLLALRAEPAPRFLRLLPLRGRGPVRAFAPRVRARLLPLAAVRALLRAPL